MIETIPWRELPFLAENRLFLDYIEGAPQALAFYAHAPTAYRAALEARRGYPYPRKGAAALLRAYNQALGASPQTLANIETLGQADAYCVVGGQQAGFLGGPVYTAYKILCTIRLARQLAQELDVSVVPVFWLASEDHDFGEINHTQYLRADGEVGRIGFDWEEKGRPIADLPITQAVQEALEAYWAEHAASPLLDTVRELFAPRTNRYCDWVASLWLRLFAEDGLVLVEPHVLRPLAGELFSQFMARQAAIRERMLQVAARLEANGYSPLLPPDTAGSLFTLKEGRRVRVEEPEAQAQEAERHPERYSTDAALRPLFADALLPVLASTLGAGELAYQGMLLPLYELFGVPQPILFPRKSYTLLSAEERERLAAYGVSPREVLTQPLDVEAVVRARVPAQELVRFQTAREQVEAAFAPLKAYLEALDPTMGRTWEQVLANALRGLERLEERAINALLSRGGYSKRELQGLRSALAPRGRLQEREFPLPHFLLRYGLRLLKALRQAGDLETFAHEILTLGGDDA